LAAFLLLPFALIGATVLGWVLGVERRPLRSIGLAPGGADVQFLRGLLIGMVTLAAVVAAIWLAGGLQAGGYAKALGSPAALGSIAVLLACFALQSGVEEIVFRGWLLSVVSRKFNVPVAVLVTSMLFSALHIGPAQPWLVTLNTFLFSVFACAWALRSDRLWGVMGWHAGWNWLLAVGFELPVTGLDTGLPALLVDLAPVGPDWLSGSARGPEGSVLCTLFFVAGTALVMARPAARAAQPVDA
jgi:uncharacterized protein